MAHVTSPTGLAVDSPQGRRLFVFDKVFGEGVRQEGVWEYVAPSVAAFLQGYNVSVMAYGQSGAGKSYTMGTSGPAEQNDRDLMGIIPRAARALFERLVVAPALSRTVAGIKLPNRYSMRSVPAVNGNRAAQAGEKNWTLKATYVEVRCCAIFATCFLQRHFFLSFRNVVQHGAFLHAPERCNIMTDISRRSTTSSCATCSCPTAYPLPSAAPLLSARTPRVAYC